MDDGNNSVSEILSMIPAMKENNNPRIVLLIRFKRKRYVSIAPRGSDKAAIKV